MITCSSGSSPKVGNLDVRQPGVPMSPLRQAADRLSRAFKTAKEAAFGPHLEPVYDQRTAGFNASLRFVRASSGKVVQVATNSEMDPSLANFLRGIAESFQTLLAHNETKTDRVEVGTIGIRNVSYDAYSLRSQAGRVVVRSMYGGNHLLGPDAEQVDRISFRVDRSTWIQNGLIVEARDASDMRFGSPMEGDQVGSGIPAASFSSLALVRSVPRLIVKPLDWKSARATLAGRERTGSLRHLPVPAQQKLVKRAVPLGVQEAFEGLKINVENIGARDTLAESVSIGSEEEILSIVASLKSEVASGNFALASRAFEAFVLSDSQAAVEVLGKLISDDSSDIYLVNAAIGATFHSRTAHAPIVAALRLVAERNKIPLLVSRAKLALGGLLAHIPSERENEVEALLGELVDKPCADVDLRNSSAVRQCRVGLFAAGNCGIRCSEQVILSRLHHRRFESDSARQIGLAGLFALRPHAHKPHVRTVLADVLNNHVDDYEVHEVIVKAAESAHQGLFRRSPPDIMDHQIVSAAKQSGSKLSVNYLAKQGLHKRWSSWSDGDSELDRFETQGTRRQDISRYPHYWAAGAPLTIGSDDVFVRAYGTVFGGVGESSSQVAFKGQFRPDMISNHTNSAST